MKAISILGIVVFTMVTSAVSAQESKVRTDRFKAIDSDGNEVITIREMKSYYRYKETKDGDRIDPKKMFYALDKNENSIITLSEYLKGEDWKLAYKYVDKWQYSITEEDVAKSEGIKKDKARIKFEKIDTDRNDTLYKNEVVTFYKGIVNKKTGDPVNAKLNFYTYDINEDGFITFNEFTQKADWKKGHDRLIAAQDKENPRDPNEPSEAYIKKRIEMFNSADSDKNFKLSIEELNVFYQDKLNKQGKPVNALFQFFGLDKNEDNSLELGEFASKIDIQLARKKYKAANGNKK
ncbi:hypothetical protein [Winogradskyella sp. PE311]|uniref:hypothetical protein n=1 Tax=Winogradskyella sp. PE311 TaxID=3366943 RepID=UPI0039810E83